MVLVMLLIKFISIILSQIKIRIHQMYGIMNNLMAITLVPFCSQYNV